MRIRVRDLIEELQRFPPDDEVKFEVVRVTNNRQASRKSDGTPRWHTDRDWVTSADFDRADEVGYVVKIQLV